MKDETGYGTFSKMFRGWTIDTLRDAEMWKDELQTHPNPEIELSRSRLDSTDSNNVVLLGIRRVESDEIVWRSHSSGSSPASSLRSGSLSTVITQVEVPTMVVPKVAVEDTTPIHPALEVHPHVAIVEEIMQEAIPSLYVTEIEVHDSPDVEPEPISEATEPDEERIESKGPEETVVTDVGQASKRDNEQAPSTDENVVEAVSDEELQKMADAGELEKWRNNLDEESTRSICPSSVADKTPPKDTFYLVYMIFLLHGVGVLMSWNMFITIAPQYYVDYWFTVDGNKTHYATSFESIIGVTSQIPNTAIMVVNMIVVIAGTLMLRIAIPLVLNCIMVGAIIVMVIFVHPSDSTRDWFYIVTLCIIMAMNLCNGVYQNSVYGIVADFPDRYLNAIVIGNNFCGIFTSVMSIMTTCISPDDIELNALLYFSISLAVLIFCLLSLIGLVRMNYYKYYKRKGEKARLLDKAENPSPRQYWECFKLCWVQLWNNFFVYFVSLVIFPAMLTNTPWYNPNNGDWGSWLREDLYWPINTFLNFNLFAAIGSMLASLVQWPKPRYLWIPILLRVVFIPFFMYCNYLPDTRKHEVVFKNEWWPTAACSVMAFTCGYFSSVALMYTPSVVPPSYQKLAGMAACIFLMLGILCGVAFTPVIATITEHW